MNLRMEPCRVGTTGRDLAEMVDDAKSRINSLFGSSDAAAEGNKGWRRVGRRNHTPGPSQNRT